MPNPNQNRVPIQIIEPEVIEELSTPLSEVYGEVKHDYQIIVNRLNEVSHKHGLEWTTQDDIKYIENAGLKEGYCEYAGKVTLMFLDENRNVVASRHCYGGAVGMSHSKAMQLAFIDAFKRVAAMFGVGAEFYLEEDK